MWSVFHILFLCFTLANGAALTAESSKQSIRIGGSCSGGQVEEYIIQLDADGKQGNWCEEACVDPDGGVKIASSAGATRGSCPSQGYTVDKGIMKQGFYVNSASHADLAPASGSFEVEDDCVAHHVERHGVCQMFCTHPDNPLNDFLHSRTNMKEGKCEENGYPTFAAEVHLTGYVKPDNSLLQTSGCTGGKVEEYVIQIDADGKRGNWCEETCVPNDHDDNTIAHDLGGTRGSCVSQGYTVNKGTMDQAIYVGKSSNSDHAPKNLPNPHGSFHADNDCHSHHTERHGLCEMFCTPHHSPLNALLRTRTNVKDGKCQDNGYPIFEAEVHLTGYVKPFDPLRETRSDGSLFHTNGKRANSVTSHGGLESERLLRKEMK